MPIRKEGLHEATASGAGNDEMQGTVYGSATGASPFNSPAPQYNQQTADAASQVRDYLSDKAARVSDKLQDLRSIDYPQVVEQAKDYARRKPGQSLLISASAGFVIGLLLRSRRRR
jgi:ElaB/YqjD/DUF883 family membrane-anchored ribosome-binding protein